DATTIAYTVETSVSDGASATLAVAAKAEEGVASARIIANASVTFFVRVARRSGRRRASVSTAGAARSADAIASGNASTVSARVTGRASGSFRSDSASAPSPARTMIAAA